jgi:hypothetical protein
MTTTKTDRRDITEILLKVALNAINQNQKRNRRGRNHMVVEFTTTLVISAYHHKSYEFEPLNGEVYHHDITEMLLKVALNTIEN